MDEIREPLDGALSQCSSEEWSNAILLVSNVKICLILTNCFWQKIGKGLDIVHPFSDTTGVDIVLRDANIILSSDFNAVSKRSPARIWSFLSKFVMLDRFGKALGVADVYPGISVPRKMYGKDYFGTATGVSHFL